MPRFSAREIHTVSGAILRNATVVTDEDGLILDLLPAAPGEDLLDGAIVPGFINSHCHLELSFLKGKVSEGAGMAGFIGQLLAIRNAIKDESIIRSAIDAADEEMFRNGIVAVGDICNTAHTVDRKLRSRILYHSFVEILGMDPGRSADVIASGTRLKETYLKNGLRATLAPHAPYTLSEQLLRQLMDIGKDDVITIHNQESEAETELFLHGRGPMAEAFHRMGIPASQIRHTGKRSLETVLPFLSTAGRLLLVHNTFTNEKDLNGALEEMGDRVYFCTCPNANLYIENRLPDYSIFRRSGAKMTVGTDSLASNHQLSILAELQTIHRNNKEISGSELLQWATLNGAEFLGHTHLGSIETGKRPGLLLLKEFHHTNFFTDVQEIVRLI